MKSASRPSYLLWWRFPSTPPSPASPTHKYLSEGGDSQAWWKRNDFWGQKLVETGCLLSVGDRKPFLGWVLVVRFPSACAPQPSVSLGVGEENQVRRSSWQVLVEAWYPRAGAVLCLLVGEGSLRPWWEGEHFSCWFISLSSVGLLFNPREDWAYLGCLLLLHWMSGNAGPGSPSSFWWEVVRCPATMLFLQTWVL